MKRLLWIAVLCALNSAAQQLTFKQFTDANGLPSSEVYQVVQDKKGYIWIATDAGVARYDGEKIETFNKSSGLPDPVVFGFMEDNDKMWLRSYSGALAFIRNDSIIPYSLNKQLVPLTNLSMINSIGKDSLGNLWVGTAPTGKLIRCDQSDCLTMDEPDHTVFVKTLEPRNFISGYVGASGLIQYLKIGDNVFPLHLGDAHGAAYFNVCVINWRNKLYVSTHANIYVFDGKTLSLFRKTNNSIISLSTDKIGNMWVGYQNRDVERFTEEDLQPTIFQPLAGKSVTSVLQDDEGGYWFSTLEGGVFHFPSLNIQLHKHEPTKISAITTIGENVYVGNYSGEVNQYALNTAAKTVAHLAKSILSLANFNGELWISSLEGTHTIEMGQKVKLLDGTPTIKDFLSSDSLLWGVCRAGIVYFDQKKRMTKHEFGLTPRVISGSINRIIISTPSGAFWSYPSLRSFKSIAELEKFKIHDMVVWNGWLLVATIGNGLVWWKEGEVINWHIHNGFNANNVYQIILKNNLALLGTEEGIFAIDLNKQNIPAHPDFQLINQLHGLPFDKNNFLALTGDVCWSFYDEGYTSFSISDMLSRKVDPRIFIKSIKVNNESVTDFYNLNYRQNNINVEIGLISFVSRKAFFRHRLSISQPWTYTKSNAIEYLSLSPGSYAVEVEYSIDQHTWKPLLAQPISISPPLWQTWYFRLAAISLVLVLIAMIVINRLKDIRMKEVAYKQFIAGVEQERIRMGGELHDNIGSKLSHFKFTQMKNGIEELETIIDDVRSLSRQLAPPFAQTDGLLPLLKSLIERTKVVTGIEINLQVFDYAEQFNQEQIIQLYRTFQELLNNLTKHSKAKTVDIQVLGYDNEVVITMDDDGIGFDMSMAYQGFGLNQLKIRAGLINGKIDITSTPGQGTHIILEVPISLKQNSK